MKRREYICAGDTCGMSEKSVSRVTLSIKKAVILSLGEKGLLTIQEVKKCIELLEKQDG